MTTVRLNKRKIKAKQEENSEGVTFSCQIHGISYTYVQNLVDRDHWEARNLV